MGRDKRTIQNELTFGMIRDALEEGDSFLVKDLL